MTPREYLDLFRERWRAILAGLLLGIAVAVGIVVTATPLYAAQVTLFVSAGTSNDPSAALDRSTLSTQRMQTYVHLITSDRVAAAVVEDLGLDETGEELAGRIAASNEPDTVLLDATVTDEDPVGPRRSRTRSPDQFIIAVRRARAACDGAPGAAVVSARVFEEAVPPTEPDSPRPVLTVAIGALLGLLAGLGLAVLRRALGTSITSRRLLADAVGAPVLGVIPRQRGNAKRPLVVRDAPRGPRAEAYRQLRTNLQFVDVDRALKVVMFTSPSPGDGTTTVLANLALTMVEAGQRVLVVEADLRRPRVADIFGAERTDGLSNVLAGRAEIADVVQSGEGGVDIVTSGPIPPNPGQLLASPRMVELPRRAASRLRRDPRRRVAGAAGGRRDPARAAGRRGGARRPVRDARASRRGRPGGARRSVGAAAGHRSDEGAEPLGARRPPVRRRHSSGSGRSGPASCGDPTGAIGRSGACGIQSKRRERERRGAATEPHPADAGGGGEQPGLSRPSASRPIGSSR